MSFLEQYANGVVEDEVKETRGMSTLAVHTYRPESFPSRPMIVPLVTSTNFQFENAEKTPEHFYGRYGTPTRDCLEKTVASMEGAKYALCYPSGVTAMLGCMQMLKPGDGVLCSSVVYGGVCVNFKDYGQKMGVDVDFINISKSLDSFRSALKGNTKMVWVEISSNPTLSILDIEEVVKIVSQHPSKPILIVDNTFLTPYYMRPIDFGVDISVHSMTKYMSGHGDILMGCVSTNRKDLRDALKHIQIDLGLVPSPFDCYLMIRSLKTLTLRMRQHSSNAQAVAEMLEGHPLVERTLYPGLPSHPDHKLAKRMLSGYSGMVSCYLKGDSKQTIKFVNALKIISYATSLGATESLASLPWRTSHGMLPEETRRSLGVTENMVRFSIGVEDIQDILNDIRQALEAC